MTDKEVQYIIQKVMEFLNNGITFLVNNLNIIIKNKLITPILLEFNSALGNSKEINVPLMWLII